jgi:hypothetical protein
LFEQSLRLQGHASAVLTARFESDEKYGEEWDVAGTIVPNAIDARAKTTTSPRDIRSIRGIGTS